MRTQILGGYRRVFRAAKNLFQEDLYAVNAFREELRSHFHANGDVKDQEMLKKLLGDLDEAEDFLKNNFVQATRNEKGNYEADLKPGDHARTIDPNEFKT